jgi:hypothetical protein
MYNWIFVLIIVSCAGAYCSKFSNDNNSYSSIPILITGIFNLLIWIWVTKVSKNLLFDSVLYDSILCITYVGVFILLKCGTSSFDITNWIGLIMVVGGLILMKV